MTGCWDESSAGGCSSDASFFLNPTFKLECEGPTKIELQSDDSYAVGLSVIDGTIPYGSNPEDAITVFGNGGDSIVANAAGVGFIMGVRDKRIAASFIFVQPFITGANPEVAKPVFEQPCDVV